MEVSVCGALIMQIHDELLQSVESLRYSVCILAFGNKVHLMQPETALIFCDMDPNKLDVIDSALTGIE